MHAAGTFMNVSDTRRILSFKSSQGVLHETVLYQLA